MADEIRKIVRKIIQKAEREDNKTLVDEGLIKTVPLEVAVNRLKFWSQKQKFIYNGEEYSRKLDVNIDQKKETIKVNILWFDRTILESFFIIVNNLGYFISEFGYEKKTEKNINYTNYKEKEFNDIFNEKENLKILFIILEAKFDKETNRVPEKLYHLCPQKNLSKILEIGLTPRSGSKISNHPERVYLSIRREDAIGMSKEFKKHGFSELKGYALLEIDREKIGNIKIFDDPNLKKKGAYVLDNIPPRSITVLAQNIDVE